MELLYKAITDAGRIHKNQKRKNSTKHVPYFCHLLGVSSIILEYGGSEIQAAAGMLHDCIEDQNITYEYLLTNYNEEIAEIVKGCTHEKIDKTQPKELWPDLIKEKRIKTFIYYKQISKDKPQYYDGIMLVSVADKLHNIRSLLKEVREQGRNAFNAFKGGRDVTLFYFDGLVDCFEQSSIIPVQDIVVEIKAIIEKIKQLTE